MRIILTTKRLRESPLFHPVHPGVIFRDELEARGLSMQDFAKMIGKSNWYASGILKGKLPMTDEIAKAIEENTGIHALSIMRLQYNYDQDVKFYREKKKESR